jgi:hypothetical protein
VASRTGLWEDVSCIVTFNASTNLVCRRTVGYKKASNGVYYRLLHQIPKNHQDARDMCKADGATLANAPYGEEDKTAFMQFVAILGGVWSRGVLDSIFVDGTDEEVEGLWKLPNGNMHKTFHSLQGQIQDST